jgi:hypothetical protein
MKAMCFAFLLALVPLENALAWGQEGHSIVAEIGERRLDTPGDWKRWRATSATYTNAVAATRT